MKPYGLTMRLFCQAYYRIGPNESIRDAHKRHIRRQVEMMVGHPVQRMN